MARRIALFFIIFSAILPVVTTNSEAQSVMTHQVREAVRNGQVRATGRLPKNQVLQLNMVLPPRDPAGLNTLLRRLYDPTSPSYRHFLTVQEFTDRFGPTKENYDAVVHFADTHGFTVVGGTRDGMNVQITGRVSSIESAFHVTMRTYRHPTENRMFYCPDKQPTTKMNFALWHISGLDNYSTPRPLFVRKSDYAKAHGIRPEDVVPYATTGSGPSSSFLGSDMRAAYSGGTALTGAGQNLGLFEFAGTDLHDLTAYFTNVGQTNNEIGLRASD